MAIHAHGIACGRTGGMISRLLLFLAATAVSVAIAAPAALGAELAAPQPPAPAIPWQAAPAPAAPSAPAAPPGGATKSEAVVPPSVPPAGKDGTYMVIPIKGAIGRAFDRSIMAAYLEKAAKLKPGVIVVDLQTPGGSVSEAEAIIDSLAALKGVRVVALVRKAISAGAAITLACKEIYISENATIGAAVSFQLDREGKVSQLPSDVAEKMQSIWRASIRKAAEHGGHPSLLAEAMVDPAFALTMRKEGDKIVFERDGAGEVIKAKNRVLTLTGREAVACGLALGLAETPEALGTILGFSGWKELGTRARATAADQPGSIETDPAVLYDAAAKTANEFGDPKGMTDLQKSMYDKQWTQWMGREHMTGRRIQWTLTLAEVSDAETARVLTSIQTKLTKYQEQLTLMMDGIRKTPSLRAQYSTNMAPLQEAIAKLTAEKRNIEANPIFVCANCLEEPRLLVAGWFPKSAKETLARYSTRGEITLCGCIHQVVPVPASEDGSMLIIARLEKCSVGGEADTSKTSARPLAPGEAKTPAAQPPQTAGSPSAEQAAMSKLNLARAYRRNGFEEKAAATYKQIITEFANTSAAQEAAKDLESGP